MENNWDPNAMLVCPYDPIHVISVKRFQRHILKCRQNHPDKDFVTCPFNAKHLFLRGELRAHLSRCADRKSLDHDIVQAECPETGEALTLKGNTSMPRANYILPEMQEDWDSEMEMYAVERYEQQDADLRQQVLDKNVRTLRQPVLNKFEIDDADDESVITISSNCSRSSLYVEPAKCASVKLQQNSNNNKTFSPAVGRGAFLQKHLGQQSFSVGHGKGRGALLAVHNELRNPINNISPCVQKVIGRGSLRDTALKF